MPRKKKYGAAYVRNEDFLTGAIDFETRGLGGELCMGQIAGPNGTRVFKKGDIAKQVIEYISDFPKPFIWFAHFAQYDWRYMVPLLVAPEFETKIKMRSETDVYEIEFLNANGDKIIMRDSFAFYPASLAKLAASMCPEIPKLEIDVANFDPENPEHEAYAVRDVVILREAIPRLNNLIEKHFGVTMGPTTAGTAVRAWQKTLPKDQYFDCSEDGEDEKFIRSGYFGGLVFLTENKPVKNCRTYDINSSYPYVMDKLGVPHGRKTRSKTLHEGKMGIYSVRVKTPDNLVIPVLPLRNQKTGAVSWRSGIFETVVTDRELIFAVQVGYTILEIKDGMVFEDIIFPFSDFIGKCKSMRVQFAGKPEETLAKLMQNSLYGRFASRRERLRIMLNWEDDDLLGAIPYDDHGLFYLKKEYNETMACLPEWSVFITAHARLRLLSTAYAAGVENVLYGDTDSLTLRGGWDNIDEGKEYGQFKLEKEWGVFRAVAPKTYAGRLLDGSYKGAAKGLSRKGMSDDKWKELLDFGCTRAESDSIPSLRVTLREGVEPSKRLSRKSSSIDNSLNWELRNGKIRPKIAA